jgi:hypothetical protein
MRNLILLIVFVLAFHLEGKAQYELKLVDPLEAIYPDRNDLKLYSNNYQADFPLNSCADVNLVLKTTLNETFNIRAYLGKKELPLSYFYELIDVPVERNTGLDSRTEIYLNQPNPNVIRKAPFQVFEALKPLTSHLLTARNPYTALQVKIGSEFFPKAGSYNCKIVLTGKDRVLTGQFTIRIHSAKLPSVANQKFLYTNWFNMVQMEKRHNVVRWTPKWFAMLDKYAKLMADGRQNCINVPSELLVYSDNKISLDEEKLLSFIKVFKKYGFQYFESPHIMNRGDNDDWGDPELKVSLTKRRYSGPEARKDVETIVQLIKNFTGKYQLEHAWLQHISDEPTLVQAKCYQEVAKQIKSIYPEIKIMDATNDRDGLVGAIDYWCPLVNDYQENSTFFNQRVRAGEKVLVYTCLIPGGKWLNRTLDMEHLRQVYFGWATAKYNTMGYLHWGLNQYSVEDPYKKSVIRHPAPGAGVNNELPAGDTHIIYPESDKPISSLRFEAHRMGIEDYELLMNLKQKDLQRYQKLTDKLFRSFTDYELSNFEYRKARKELLESL